MKKILYILYQPYKWLVLVPVLGLSTFFFGTIAIIMAFLTNAKIGSLVAGVSWAKVNSFMTPMLVSVKGKKNINKKQSYVVVSNHQSHYDIFVLYGWLGVDFKWIMKKELRKVPVLGVACERLGHIFIDRSNREAALSSINDAKRNIVNGTSVIFFPEGTRSDSGELGEFKKGAFKMALQIGLPILPITIIGTRKILPTKTLDLFPGRAKMIIHEPVETSGYNDDNIQELMDRIRDIIKSAI